jgi:2-polyprenyl-3-methyl-5-hydroxy-6-metoxy-1,4-benzoquinol methylase
MDPTAGLVPVACPRCGAHAARHRYRLVECSIVTCESCALSYVSPRASSERLRARLQEWATQDVVDEERLRTAFDRGNLEHYRRLLDRLARHAGPGRRLLDVGCATGAFLGVARDAGWSVKGLEIGEASARHAREQLGLDVERASLYEFASGDRFDAVAFLEVIEHLERPGEALQRIRELLAPGGLLLLTTPNFDSLYRRLFGSRWWVVNCEDEHIVLFNRATLAGLLEESGFELQDLAIRGLDVAGLAREARATLGGRGGSGRERAAQDYYESRAGRARLKGALERLGLLSAAKAGLRALDTTFSWRFSPTHGWGEQLVAIARRR